MIESRTEYIDPQIDHRNSWDVLLTKGISPSLRSELYMIKNDLHPSQEHLHRFKKANTSECLKCGLCDSHGHFIVCIYTRPLMLPLHTALRKILPNISAEQIANLDIPGDSFATFTVCWLLANISQYIWKCKRRNIDTYDVTLHGLLKAELRYFAQLKSFEKQYNFLTECVNSIVL